MIAITAYTEPVPIDPVVQPAVVHEPPQTEENEKKEERSSFAELLAGLLQNTQSAELPVSEVALEELGVGNVKESRELNLFADAVDSGIDFENLDLELSQEQQNILLNAGDLFEQSAETEISAVDADGTTLEYFDTKSLKLSADVPVQTDLASMAKAAETESAAQLAAASEAALKQSAKEALGSSDNKKKGEGSINADNAQLSAKTRAGEENAAVISKREDAPTRLEEFRRSRRDKVSFEVRDFRTNTMSDGSQQRAYSLVETSAVRAAGQAPVQEITLDLRLPDQGHSSQAQTTWEAKASTALENMLARELHQSFNGDIVRHASMALRNGGEGTIKIALHPETLGNVKIHLEMTENKITGHIVVESEEALNAFRKEINALEQAFKDSGYADASLDLSLTADGADREGQELYEGTDSFMQRIAASGYEDGYDQESAPIVDIFFGRGTGSVNMLA